MTRNEVAKALGIKPCTVESIERTAFKKIRQKIDVYAKYIDLLDRIDCSGGQNWLVEGFNENMLSVDAETENAPQTLI